MAPAKTKKTPVLVTVDRNWQVAFITALVASQLITVGAIVWQIVHYSHYTGSGTWVFQILQWFYPLLFLAAGYVFTLRRIRGKIPRLFWAIFVATMGMAIYTGLNLIFDMLMAHFEWWPQVGPNDHSWWAAYGVIWVEMGVAFVLYCAVLWLVGRERKRR